MLSMIRTQPIGSALSTFLDVSISLRDGNNNVDGHPDIPFSIKTYVKISKDGEHEVGDRILLPINLFFKTLSDKEHRIIYAMYKYTKTHIDQMTKDNRREYQDRIQLKVYETIRKLDIPTKLIRFCKTDLFVYPDLSEVGKLPHHSKEKTFLIDDYVEITAISLLSKMMVPIWGEFVKILGDLGIGNNQRERIAFDLIEPSLEESSFARIYTKLSNSLESIIDEIRKNIDKKPMGSTTTSFIVTHNGIDDEMFDSIVMATIVMKRMAPYECFTLLKDGNVPNAMVYIYDSIMKTADTRIKAMRNTMNTMPRRELPSYDTEDNSSILDHASKTSNRPIDDHIYVTTAVGQWELPKLLEDTNTPMDVYSSAVDYYSTNSFDVSPMTQALVASFIGARFGGSKCINYLPLGIHQKIVTIMQIFLISQGMTTLASLASACTSQIPIDGGSTNIALRIMANLKSSEYLRCQSIFKGDLEKPSNTHNKRGIQRKIEVDKIGFVNQISRMAEWLIRYSHKENMAPVLWEYAKVADRPVVGSECSFDENTIRNLCQFYLIMHNDVKPF